MGRGAGALILPLMALAITNLGWRSAMLISGTTLMAAGLAVVAIVRNTPEEVGLTPDGDAFEARTAGEGLASAAGATLGQAARTPFFWAISLGGACMLFINSGIIFHMVPLLGSKGESAGVAASVLSFQLFLTLPVVLVCA